MVHEAASFGEVRVNMFKGMVMTLCADREI